MTYVDQVITVEPSLADRPMRFEPSSLAQNGSKQNDAGQLHLAPLLSVLLLLIDETRSVVVNVTSAHRGAGTSMVARKLAAAAAATGWCRVALLDAGVPTGSATETAGLVERVERGESPALTRRQIGAVEVDVGCLCSGGRPLSRIESVRKLYGTLRDRYSLVIVDCPAVLAGQQTLTVAAAADETVLVVEAERTALADVARTRAALEQRGAGVLGLVMNKSRPRLPARLGGSS